MKIGVIASLAGTASDDAASQQVARALTEGFVSRGHEVTLFASADTITSARLMPTAAPADDDPAITEALHIAAAMERVAEFDVVVNQAGYLPLTYSRLIARPVITTVSSLGPQVVRAYQAYDDIGHYVSISESSRCAELTYDATIEPGVDTAAYTFVREPGRYLLVLGDVAPSLGVHLAIAVAKQVGLPLIIAGEIADESYFRDYVQPHLDEADISYLGAVGTDQRNTLLGGALALIRLATVGDDFGISLLEALAAGTPVIATPLGSTPDIIRDGITGFLVADVVEAVDAVGRTDDIDRRVCRKDAVDRFGSDRMVTEYLALFQRIRTSVRLDRPLAVQKVGAPGLFSHSGFPTASY